MTLLAKTILNSVNTFAGITDNWNAWNWGSFKWGEGTADLPISMTHLISESILPDSGVKFEVEHIISEILFPTSAMNDEELTDGSNYTYVYPSDVTNAQNRVVTNYTSGINSNDAWTSGAVNPSIWS